LKIMNAAADGAGYIAAGEAGQTLGSQIAASLNASTDVVVFFGSDNDAGQDPADLKAAVTDALSDSKTLAPHAARIVVGPLTAFDQAKRPGSYGDSKLYISTLVAAIARLFPDVWSNSLDPGWVPTRMADPAPPTA
jgi:hypothetical protein